MRKLFACILATMGLTTACSQNYEDTDVNGFAELVQQPDVIVLDVRTDSEFAEAHLEVALHIDQAQGDFIEQAKKQLPTDKTIAIYCRSGRRSANAASRLADEGYKCVNLKGGIVAWKEANMPVTADTYETDVFKTQGGKAVRFFALTHASIRIDYNGKQIMIDPVTKMGDKTIDYNSMRKADYILVTHEHFDHFDRNAIQQLSDENTQLITNQRCTDMLGALPSVKIMANGDRLLLSDDITVEAVPAYNTTEGRQQFHPKGRDNGFILTLDGLRIYIAGDTEDIPEMSVIKDIDIAFMPCNQPYTMTVAQLINAAKTVKPNVLFPYHYGQTDVSTLPSELQAFGIDVRIRHYE